MVSGLKEVLVTSFESGYPILYFRGYNYAGVNKDTGAPIYLDKDGKETDTIGENDKQYLGEGIPNFTYGITANFAYKSTCLGEAFLRNADGGAVGF